MAILLALVCCAGSVGITVAVMGDKESQPVATDNAALYQQAINDAVVAENDEILPVVEIKKDNDMVRWNEAGDKVLLLTFHRFPDSYPDGADVNLKWGTVWTFSEKEFAAWYEKNGANVKDWSLRIKQLLGMPETSENSYITAMWASPEDLQRPAYVTDITSQMKNSFDEDAPEDESYVNWFNSNAVYSYCDNTYPWTRLGYTYDWADNDTEYGLSEFLVAAGADVTVEYTKTVDDFIELFEK